MLIFSVSFQFFVCHSEEDILLWEGSRRINTETNCVRSAGLIGISYSHHHIGTHVGQSAHPLPLGLEQNGAGNEGMESDTTLHITALEAIGTRPRTVAGVQSQDIGSVYEILATVTDGDQKVGTRAPFVYIKNNSVLGRPSWTLVLMRSGGGETMGLPNHFSHCFPIREHGATVDPPVRDRKAR